MVDTTWNDEDRDIVALYLQGGTIVRSYMGFSLCRICGEQNGNNEMSDGTYVWPEGLGHYVRNHSVRLPQTFVAHVLARLEALESAERDEAWWASFTNRS